MVIMTTKDDIPVNNANEKRKKLKSGTKRKRKVAEGNAAQDLLAAPLDLDKYASAGIFFIHPIV